MTAAAQIAKWVEQKPIILSRLDEAYSERLLESARGFEHLTIAKPHEAMRDYKLPTVCIIEVQTRDGPACYLGSLLRKATVTLFESRVTIKRLRPIELFSLEELESAGLDSRMARLLRERIPEAGEMTRLSPKASAAVIRWLARQPNNGLALDVAVSTLPKLRRLKQSEWAQEDAIQTALSVFGIRANDIAEQVAVRRNSSTGLGLVGARLHEDNVIRADASQLPGFEAVAPDLTGRAVFQKRGERLTVYTANKLPLEEMLGVDLIYVNETRGNIVMVQYKMLEKARGSESRSDWIFRADYQLRDEIRRMRIPPVDRKPSDFRLNGCPFFFKFVKRKESEDSHRAFLLALDHVKQVLGSGAGTGPRGGVRVSYDALDGTYLRETDMVSLIRSGYVGTHRVESDALAALIEDVARGNRGLVLAWQKRIAALEDEAESWA